MQFPVHTPLCHTVSADEMLTKDKYLYFLIETSMITDDAKRRGTIISMAAFLYSGLHDIDISAKPVK